MKSVRYVLGIPLAALLVLASGCASDEQGEPQEPADPGEVAVGERLFLETRFAQFFYEQNGGRVNTPLSVGDPVMDLTQTTLAPLPGPFQGQSMNCRSCHLVDEQADYRSGGVRTYSDFARRSPIPARDDGRVTTPRNSPSLVDASLPRSVPFFLHFDGEFASLPDLAEGTLTGRNYGWLPNEHATAIAHIADVIRNDDGRDALAAELGGFPYRVLFLGEDPAIPPDLLLPEPLRIDVEQANDEEVVAAVSNVIGAYVESLVFAQDPDGDFDGSPYDRFLRKNGLPPRPDLGESDVEYSRRLRTALDELRNPRYVNLSDGSFELHAQEFVFGRLELQGLRIFLAEQNDSGAVGNCLACHPAPNFTDFSFHNTGTAQDEYDAIHGPGAFSALAIPDLEERNANPDLYLPPSADYPNALGTFLDVPASDRPGATDLGVWNVLGNPAVPAPQAGLANLLCAENDLPPSECNASALLPLSIATFKTPGLRSLGQSAPYMHTGQLDTLEDVIDFYIRVSSLSRAGMLRNPAAQLSVITLTDDDIAPLAAFLRALNEDYE